MMKKKTQNLLYNFAIGVVTIVIILLVIFKFVLSRDLEEPFSINEFEKITVTDLTGNPIRLADVMDKNQMVYCFFFEMTNCYSCIYDGIEELNAIKKAGKSCFGIVVHHLVDEVAGWSANYDFSPFFMLKKEDFYHHIQAPIMPVMAKIKNGKLQAYKYIRQ